MKFNAIQNHWISINITGHPKETFLSSTCLELILARSSLFKLPMACYWLLHFLQAMKLHKSTSTKECKCYYKRDSFYELQTRQVVLQSRAGNRKLGNFYYKEGWLLLQGGAIIRQQCSTEGKWKNMGNTFWQPAPSFNPNLPGDRHFTLHEFFRSWNSVIIKRKKKSPLTPLPTTVVSAWLVSLRNNYLELFLALKTIFLKLL